MRWIAASAIAALVVSGCCGRTVAEQVTAAAERASEGHDPLRLWQATAFEWERVLVFEPMTPRREMAATAGVPEPELDVTREGVEPDEHRLVFMRGGEVVESIALARNELDVDCEGSHVLPWEQATFSVRRGPVLVCR